jgi:hypothetical protein
MRKIISLGLLALSLGFFSSSLLAGNVEDCEQLKDPSISPGLYGLCIAYWNADSENARERILGNYEKKATGPLDPAMPGLNNNGPVCPCWLNGELDLAGTSFACEVSEGYTHAEFDLGVLQYTASSSFCLFSNFGSDPTVFNYLQTTPEESEACIDDMIDLIAANFESCD